MVSILVEDGLSIGSLAELHAQTMDALNKDQRVTLDLREVRHVDAAGIQWLLSVRRASTEHAIKIVGWSDGLIASAAVLGMADMFVEKTSATEILQ